MPEKPENKCGFALCLQQLNYDALFVIFASIKNKNKKERNTQTQLALCVYQGRTKTASFEAFCVFEHYVFSITYSSHLV